MSKVGVIGSGFIDLLEKSSDYQISYILTRSKRDIRVGETIKKGIGSFEMRWIAIKIKEHPNHVPSRTDGKCRI